MKNKTKIFNKIFTGIFCTVIIALMITLADLFSGLITVGGYSFASENITSGELNYYAVCTTSHDTKILADELSETIQLQGGAGYVYMNKHSYYVVAGIYQTEADAEKVKQNLIQSKPQTSIVKITIPSISLTSNLTQQEKTAVLDSLAIFKNIYLKLYDIAVSLDTNVVTEVNARLQINELASTLNTTLSNYTTLFSNNLTTELLKIKISLEDAKKLLDTLVNSSSLIPFTSLVKETYCKIVVCHKNLCEGLNM